MAHGEKVNVLIMRDNGEVRSVRMRLSLLIFLSVFAVIAPFVAAGGVWLASDLWWNQDRLMTENQRLAREGQEARAKAERLGNLERLLQRNAATESALAVNTQRVESKEAEAAAAARAADEQAVTLQEGPGHSEFPTTDTGFVTVENVSVRQQPGSRLRISLDLRNPDSRKALAGEVISTLVTAAGENIPLQFRPAEAGDFRITRLKRAVLVTVLPPQTNFTNAQVVVEVKSEAGELVYRNIFPVER